MFKIICELAMDPLGLPIEFYWEWLILVAINQISYRIAFDKVGGMYNSGMISGSIAGSFFNKKYIFCWDLGSNLCNHMDW